MRFIDVASGWDYSGQVCRGAYLDCAILHTGLASKFDLLVAPRSAQGPLFMQDHAFQLMIHGAVTSSHVIGEVRWTLWTMFVRSNRMPMASSVMMKPVGT